MLSVTDSIQGKRVVITGASTGIGEQLAYQYSKLGAKVLITARRENVLQQVIVGWFSFSSDIVHLHPRLPKQALSFEICWGALNSFS